MEKRFFLYPLKREPLENEIIFVINNSILYWGEYLKYNDPSRLITGIIQISGPQKRNNSLFIEDQLLTDIDNGEDPIYIVEYKKVSVLDIDPGDTFIVNEYYSSPDDDESFYNPIYGDFYVVSYDGMEEEIVYDEPEEDIQSVIVLANEIRSYDPDDMVIKVTYHDLGG